MRAVVFVEVRSRRRGVRVGRRGISVAVRGSDGDRLGVDAFHNPAFAAVERRWAAVAAGGLTWHDPRENNALPDIYISMGQTAENVAQVSGVTRHDQDEFAARALQSGAFADEIIPITLPDGRVFDVDECPRPGKMVDVLTGLKPVFRPDGSVTAGNRCPLNDGAAAVVVMSEHMAKELGLTPLARIVSFGASGLSPEIMGLGPVDATQQALERAGLTIDDIDLVEINEAFAAQVLACQRELKIDIDRLNVDGGAIALGHPFGMTGARITATLLNSLRRNECSVRSRDDVHRRRGGQGNDHRETDLTTSSRRRTERDMPTITFDFTGLVVIVTGAARGIGLGLSRFFRAAGADVAMVDRDADELDAAARGLGAFAIPADVASSEAVEAAVRMVVDEFGHVDVLVNNAGILRDAVVWKLTDDDWDAVLTVQQGKGRCRGPPRLAVEAPKAH